MYHFFFGKNRSKILISLATYAYCQVPSIFVQWFRKKKMKILQRQCKQILIRKAHLDFQFKRTRKNDTECVCHTNDL